MERILSRLSDGRLLDVSPMASRKPPVVLNSSGWASFEGTLGEVTDSRPLSKEEIARLVAAGALSQ